MASLDCGEGTQDAYVAIVLTTDLKRLIFNTSGAVGCNIGCSLAMADQMAANLWRIATLDESVGRPRWL